MHDGPADAADDLSGTARLTVWARGRVQGVGFRWWVRSRALELGLAGSAANLRDGRVEVVAEGPRDACDRMVALLEAPESGALGRPGQVAGVTVRWDAPRGGLHGFHER